jgi:hypothetical protein
MIGGSVFFGVFFCFFYTFVSVIEGFIYLLLYTLFFVWRSTSMVKIQEIKRKNGSVVRVLYLPNEVVVGGGFVKGDVVEVVVDGPGVLRVVKR